MATASPAEPLPLTTIGGDGPAKHVVCVGLPPASPTVNRLTLDAFRRHHGRHPAAALIMAGEGALDPVAVAAEVQRRRSSDTQVHVASVGDLRPALSTMDGLREHGVPTTTALLVDVIESDLEPELVGRREPRRVVQLAVEAPSVALTRGQTLALLDVLPHLDDLPDGLTKICDWESLLDRDQRLRADEGPDIAFREYLAHLAPPGEAVDMRQGLPRPDRSVIVWDTSGSRTADGLLDAMRAAGRLMPSLREVATIVVPVGVDLHTDAVLPAGARRDLVRTVMEEARMRGEAPVYLYSDGLLRDHRGTVVPRPTPTEPDPDDEAVYLRDALTTIGGTTSAQPGRPAGPPQRQPILNGPGGMPGDDHPGPDPPRGGRHGPPNRRHGP